MFEEKLFQKIITLTYALLIFSFLTAVITPQLTTVNDFTITNQIILDLYTPIFHTNTINFGLAVFCGAIAIVICLWILFVILVLIHRIIRLILSFNLVGKIISAVIFLILIIVGILYGMKIF